ncbi:MAG: hypothetical protein H0W64_06620 [Gammaproteobacteria bacterium]|nr:hypothetical protein [Gammaproteobacteria bacterium]
MIKKCLGKAIVFWSLFFFSLTSYASPPQPLSPKPIKGIYITQWNFENTSFLRSLIGKAKAAKIDTFVVDLEIPSKRYQANLELLHDNHIKYVARIVMFPDGGTPAHIKDPAIWQKKYKLVQQAVDWGAQEIQLDYIRYNTKQKPSAQNSHDIHTIIQWYKAKLAAQKVPLQIDVFGVTSFGESKHIGQNIKLFSQTVDAICPMVYPSHYVPFAVHFNKPYNTVFDSLDGIKKQFNNQVPMKVYAYIELSNYHFRMSQENTMKYISAQLKAVEAAGADGWYAWSPHNRYDNLFKLLQSR